MMMVTMLMMLIIMRLMMRLVVRMIDDGVFSLVVFFLTLFVGTNAT